MASRQASQLGKLASVFSDQAGKATQLAHSLLLLLRHKLRSQVTLASLVQVIMCLHKGRAAGREAHLLSPKKEPPASSPAKRLMMTMTTATTTTTTTRQKSLNRRRGLARAIACRATGTCVPMLTASN